MEKSKSAIARQVAQQAQMDVGFLKQLMLEPVETVKKVRHEISDDDAREVAGRAAELISPVPGVEIRDLVEQMLNSATTGFRITLVLSQVLFYFGLALLGATFILEAVSRVTGLGIGWQNLAATGIIGAIGVGTIMSSFILRPLDKIQNSVGNLVQVQVAFVAYFDQLMLIMRHRRTRDLNQAIQASDKIAAAAESTMKLIEQYCEYRLRAPTTKPTTP